MSLIEIKWDPPKAWSNPYFLICFFLFFIEVVLVFTGYFWGGAAALALVIVMGYIGVKEKELSKR